MSILTDTSDANLAELVAELERIEAATARLQAQRARVLTRAFALAEDRTAGVGERVKARDMELRNISCELAAAVHLSDRSVQVQISRAWTLMTDFPGVHAALSAGELGWAHACVIVEAGVGIVDPDARATYEARAVLIARTETPGRLRGLLTTIAEDLLPSSPTERHRLARQGRNVSVTALPDGMCQLTAVLPAVLGTGIMDRLTRMGVAMRDAGRQAARDAQTGSVGTGGSRGAGSRRGVAGR